MTTDPSWLYSTIAQSSAAIVAVIGGFITATVLMLTAEKRSLSNQKEDKEARLQTLRNEKGKLSRELDAKEVHSFIESITDELINSEELPSLEEMMQNHPETQNLNCETLKREYEGLSKQVLEARTFTGQHLDKINPRKFVTLDEWVRINNFDTSAYDYEILERAYNRAVDQKQELLSDLERAMTPPNLLRMRLPYIPSIAEQRELENLSDKTKETEYEISVLENDVASLDTRLKTFSYPQNLGLGLFVLLILALFGIIIPVLVIFAQAFSVTNGLRVIISFIAALVVVFAYIYAQISSLRRK